jgi:hypothetical protein
MNEMSLRHDTMENSCPLSVFCDMPSFFHNTPLLYFILLLADPLFVPYHTPLHSLTIDNLQWAGKTIALGTFPSAEADEKCARAKALTRAWRSTMRPKPSRDWVMVELERLGVRVVSGRLGRKAGEEDDDEAPAPRPASAKKPKASKAQPQQQATQPQQQLPPVDRKNSLGWGMGELDQLMQRRSSSLGLSIMNEADFSRRGSLGSLGPALGLDADLPPPHRPLVGGGAAAAYEAARADHYQQKRDEQQRRASSLGLGMSGNMGGMGGLSVNPNQHYEMLKLHHMNLLNEIQETTLMMNLYQQQQLQQQQQHLQQQHTGEGGNDIGLMMQGNDFGRLSQRGSLALGIPSSSSTQMMGQQQAAGGANATSTLDGASSGNKESELSSAEKEKLELEAKLQKLKEDIARQQKEAEELEKQATSGGEAEKRKAEDEDADADGQEPKKSKTEESSE